jgi:DNA-nicking Smr family endonuclease
MDDGDRNPDRSDEERSLFEAAMRDVQPIERPPPLPARRLPRPARRPRTDPRIARGARFEVEVTGERLRGRLPGFDLRQIGHLERGDLPPELTVDLHGFSRVEARSALRDALRQARRTGLRSVRVIHGRGLRSDAGPVLKTALPGWLAEPPLDAWVLAFASAPPHLGGPGATLVLLRVRKLPARAAR